MPSAYIDDGYTLSATVHSDAGLFDDFRIVYRKMAKAEQAEFDTKAKDQTPIVIARLMADWMAKKLVSWTLKKRDQSPISISQKSCLQTDEPAFNAVWNYVTGYSAADPETEDDAEKNCQPV